MTETPADVVRRAAKRLREDAAAIRIELAENVGCLLAPDHGPDECYRDSIDDGLGGVFGRYAGHFTPGFADLLAYSWETQADDMAEYPAIIVLGGVGIATFAEDPNPVWSAAYHAAHAYLEAVGADR